ncbi:RNA polymerase sigma factor [Dactylosporangium sp. NPDC051485]|uniref:RNA polymerase sigma factor n=1 Tax=Dactylosporangium sp. NPDC051485 TaxID=3154846 RepID=UPI003443D9B6
MTDLDLLGRAAFGELFRRYSRPVYNHCFRRLASWSAAEDATSIVFLEAWRRREAAVTDAAGSLLPWLLGIATNVTRNQRRAARRYATALYRLPGVAAEADHAEDVAERLDDERRMRHVLAALSGLSRDEQDVVALIVMSGLSYQQAAVALGVPEGTVASRLGRAKARLRRRPDLLDLERST